MRIAIVNDLPTATEMLRRTIVQGGHELAWAAVDGFEAIERVKVDQPDLILMDMVMPGMDGAEATRRIVRDWPCSILVVTASVRSNAPLVYEAIGAGAMDVVRTPTLESASHAALTELMEKINLLQRRIDMQRRTNAEQGTRSKRSDRLSTSRYLKNVLARSGTPHGRHSHDVPFIGVGASEGGPRALASVLELLPPEFPACFVVVQHLDFRFMEGLADWFDRQTALKVRPLCDGDRPAAGTVLVAATRQHVVLSRDGSFRYTAEPRDALFRPSIDAFFSSCARRPTPDSTFLLLSGMSSDGAEGLLALREAGCHTIAQDASTSAVFGMPRAAISIGAARAVLGIGEIASELCARYGSHPLIV